MGFSKADTYVRLGLAPELAKIVGKDIDAVEQGSTAAVDGLSTSLASPDTAEDGAGRVGFSDANAYAAGTVGEGIVAAQSAATTAFDRAVEAEETALAAVANPAVSYTTLSSLNADLAHAAGTQGFVTGDGSNNGQYLKSGSSGSGSWAKVSNYTIPGLASYSQLGIVRSLFSQLYAGRYDLGQWVDSGYIAKADGTEAALSTWRRTDYIPVRSTTTLLWDGDPITDSSSAAAVAFYSSPSPAGYLGYVQPGSTPPMETTVGAHQPTAQYVRFSYRVATPTRIYVKDPTFFADQHKELDLRFGAMATVPFKVESGYISSANGSEQTSGTWSRSVYIPVTADTVLVRNGPYLNFSGRATVAFYDATTYLGAYSPLDRDERMYVGALWPAATRVRISWTNAAGVPAVYRADKRPAGDVEIITSALRHDFLHDDEVVSGYINTSGALLASGSWSTTKMIPVIEGQVFTLTTNMGVGTVAHVSGYNSDGIFTTAILTGGAGITAYTNVRVVVPAGVAYVRASAANTADFHFYGAQVRGANGGVSGLEPSFFLPTEVYALQGEALYLYPRGICADRAYDLTLSLSESNEDVAIVTPEDTDPIPVTVHARGPDNAEHALGTFNILVIGTPVNPVAVRNVFLGPGDSLWAGVNGSVQGAIANEASRRISGVGDALLSGGLSPAALALSNIKFRGTLGTGMVKHEGRAGWSEEGYLTLASGNGSSNAFWNPSTEEFDIDYYLTTNSFDDGSLAGGVNSTGSNATFVVGAGWNNPYTRTAAEAATNLGNLIDAIHSLKPDADIIVAGLNPAPRLNIKSFDGTRYVSEREVFELVKSLGAAYRAVCQTKPNCYFMPVAHVFNPEVAYLTATRAISARSLVTQTGASDHVHPADTGYAMFADALFYMLLYLYCQ